MDIEEYNRNVADPTLDRSHEINNRRNDLMALVKLGLGEDLDEQTFERLYVYECEFRDKQYAIIEKLTADEISFETYVISLNDALKLFADDSKALLGEKFEKIFGDVEVLFRDMFSSNKLNKFYEKTT